MQLDREGSMTEETSIPSRHDLEAKIVKRCWEDDKFHKEFIADPKGVFVKYLQVPASSLPQIVVHQEAPGSWDIVLPPQPADANELSEEDLEKVAGGTTPVVSIEVTIILTVAASVGVSGGLSETVGGW
jgi:hypothetical protein